MEKTIVLILSNAYMQRMKPSGVRSLMQEFKMDINRYDATPTGLDVRYTAITAKEVK